MYVFKDNFNNDNNTVDIGYVVIETKRSITL